MRKQTFQIIVLVGLFLLGSAPGFADELWVRNKPYKGEVLGTGAGSLVQLAELAKVLEMEAVEKDGAWTLGGLEVVTEAQDGNVYVSLSSLKAAGFRVVENKDLGTIDLHVPEGTSAGAPAGTPAGSWGDGSNRTRLVYFGAKW